MKRRDPVGRGAERAAADIRSRNAGGAKGDRREPEEESDDRDPRQNSPLPAEPAIFTRLPAPLRSALMALSAPWGSGGR